MKLPARTSPGSKTKRKSRDELNQEARDRKREKKRSGHAAGSRANPATAAQKSSGGNKTKDPRIGSKTPVPLGTGAAVSRAKPVTPPRAEKAENLRLAPEEELAMLENNERLDALLDRLEGGETLSGEEQAWLDQTLDRIDVLMEQLGIGLDDDADDDEAEEDMYRLLKGHRPS